MRDLDHKILVTRGDTTFMNPDLFEPEGIVVLEGKGPSVENVAVYVWNHAVETIRGKFPDRGKTYRIEVTIQKPRKLLHRREGRGGLAGAERCRSAAPSCV